MKYKTIIFDLDGTLLDTLEDLKNSVNYSLEKYHYPTRTLAEVRDFIGNGVKVLLTRAFPVNTPITLIEEALIVFREHYAKHMYDNTCLYPGILELLTELKNANYRLAIVSNKLDSAVKELNERFFTEYIPLSIGTSANAKKPNPFHVLEVMKTLDSTATDTIYIGDSDVDIETAKNAGIPCVGVSWGFRGREFLETHHADYVIDHPSELMEIIK